MQYLPLYFPDPQRALSNPGFSSGTRLSFPDSDEVPAKSAGEVKESSTDKDGNQKDEKKQQPANVVTSSTSSSAAGKMSASEMHPGGKERSRTTPAFSVAL